MKWHGFAAVTLVVLGGCALGPPRPVTGVVDVTVLAINDFHGNIQTPPGKMAILDPSNPAAPLRVEAGGAETLATVVKQARAANPNSIFVAAGDLIGASPLISAHYHDEPTVEALSLMGLDLSAVGNHEFDEGRAELLRMQKGGCHAVDKCQTGRRFKGASYRYLAASTIDVKTGRPVLPAYSIRKFEGVPVAFIGLSLEGTPDLVSPASIAGLRFQDEIETVNALVPKLRAKGVEAIVVLIHEGGRQAGDYSDPNACAGMSGPILAIVNGFDKAVDVVITGHTHRPYNCQVDGRLVTSADKFGSVVSNISLKIDRATRDVVEAKADNMVVRVDAYAKDAAQTALVGAYARLIQPVADREIGKLNLTLSNVQAPNGDSEIGNQLADAYIAAMANDARGKPVIAFVNTGGIRESLVPTPDGKVTYGAVFAVQPFDNKVVAQDLTGTEIATLLEQQWLNQSYPKIMLVSQGFTYTWDNAKPDGQRVLTGSIRLNGQPVEAGATYRVALNSFMGEGGDGYTVLKNGRNKTFGMADVDALEAWIDGQNVVQPGPLDRIRRLN